VNLGSDPLETAKRILSDFASQQNPAQLSDWTSARVISSRYLAGIRKEYEASVQSKTFQFSEGVMSYLRGYRINSLADVQKFLDAQAAFPER
jgi:hypothetical protein